MEFVLKIQSFLENLRLTILSLIKVVLLSKKPRGFNIKNSANELIIMGNGPSLIKEIEKYKSFLIGKDLACVNNFPLTGLYSELRPKYYITSAPEYWLENLEADAIERSSEMFNALSEKTTWPLHFFIPYEAKKYKRWQKLLNKVENIEFNYYNNIGIEGFKSIISFLFKKGIGMPRPHNVLVTSIYLSINMGYKKIYLFGADHSWLKELNVSEDNIALLNQKHFYDENTSKPEVMKKKGSGQRKLHEILHKFMLTFEGYFILKEYARKNNVQILNATKGSFIDAFDRIDLEKQDGKEKQEL